MNHKPAAIIDTLDVMVDMLNKNGWDLPPMLFTLNRMTRKSVSGQDQSGYEVMQIPAPIGFTGGGGNVKNELVAFALGMLYQENLFQTPELARSAVGEGFAGLVFHHEAYMAAMEPDTREALRRSGRSIGDHPDAKEVRNLCAVDVNGRTYLAQHERGGTTRILQAEADGTVNDPSARAITGPIPAAVKLIVIGLCRFLEPHEHSMPPVLPLLPGEREKLNPMLLAERHMAQLPVT